MKKQFFLITIGLLACGLAACSDNEKSGGWVDPDVPRINDAKLSRSEAEVLDGLNKFGFDMMRDVSANYDEVYADAQADGNISVSPLSAGLALAMVANSAQPAEANKIAEALHCTDLDALNTLSNKLIRALTYKDDITVRLANSVWHKDNYSLSESYKQVLHDVFCAQSFAVPFDESTTAMINGWCSDKTQGLIDKVLEGRPGATIIYYLNAMYAAGDWNNPFDEADTKTEVFKGRDGDSDVDMMHVEEMFKVNGRENYTAVRLPFGGNKASMIFILPDEGVDVEELAAELTYDEFVDMREHMCFESVTLALPKFVMKKSSKLGSTFGRLGVPAEINLCGIGIDDFVGLNATQFTATEIDEQGAKAASVTVVGGDTVVLPTGPVELTFDRPFLYFFCDETTGTILMSGRVCNL